MRNPIQKLLDKYLEEGKIISICEDGERSATFVTSNGNEWTITQLPYKDGGYYCEMEEEGEIEDLCYQVYDGPMPTVTYCKDCMYESLADYWSSYLQK